MQSYRVADLMNAPALIIAPSASLVTAQELMDRHKVRRLPVVEHGHLVGIITIGDLREAQPSVATTLSVYEWRALLDRVTVAEVMTRDPLVVTPDTPVLSAAQVLLSGKIGGLPVVEEGHVVGMITESDLFRLLIADLSGGALAPPPTIADVTTTPVMLYEDHAPPALICHHCGTLQPRHDPKELHAEDECVHCHYHLIRCDNCRFFDSVACMLDRPEHFDSIPGHTCTLFRYRLAQSALVEGGA